MFLNKIFLRSIEIVFVFILDMVVIVYGLLVFWVFNVIVYILFFFGFKLSEY